MDKMRNTRILTASAMLLAIAVILGFFKIPVNQFMELRFAFLPIACTGMLFGPFVGGVVGALSDILGYLVKPVLLVLRILDLVCCLLRRPRLFWRRWWPTALHQFQGRHS